MRLSSEVILADASASTGGLGKIGTVAAAEVLYVRIPCGGTVERVLWRVKCNKAHTVTLYRCATIPTATLTMADATAVDDGDTFVLNGLTFTAETTEGDASAAARKWYHPSQAAGAVNLAALLMDATYGVPGLASASAAAVDATDVITITSSTNSVLQFGQGTSASNEIAFSNSVLASLVKDGAAVSGLADNSTTAGTHYEQYVNGWEQAYLAITNNDGSNAATVTVAARLLPWT